MTARAIRRLRRRPPRPELMLFDLTLEDVMADLDFPGEEPD
jgi:hypothetical protein